MPDYLTPGNTTRRPSSDARSATLDEVTAEIRAAMREGFPHDAYDMVNEAIAARTAEVLAIGDEAEGVGRELRASDQRDLDRLRSELATLDGLREAAERAARRQAGETRAEVARRRELEAAADLTPAGQRRETPVRVGREPRTYTPETARQGVSLLADIFNQGRGDPNAAERLARHNREEQVERRDIGTGAVTGLVVPQYLTDLAAPLARAARPLADVCRMLPLPGEGMTVNISRITTGATVAAQDGQNTAVSETDIDDTLLTVPVVTVAGMQDVARQAVERGTGVDEVVVADLMAAYAAELDRQLIHGTGANGQHLGLLNTTGNIDVVYTDASPTAAELYPKLADLIQQIQTATYLGVSNFVLHPRRWWWLAKEISTSFPFLTIPSAGPNSAGSVGGTDYPGRVGARSILGVPVVLDGNISITQGAGAEDSILGITAAECFLWEAPASPLMIRSDQALSNQLTIRFVLYGYSAFTAGRRPTANGNILGTGMTTPSFA